VIGEPEEKLTGFGKKMVRLSLGRQFRQSFLGQILLIISIVPNTHALAGSSSGPLAVTVAVVRSCNVTTALPLVAEDTAAGAKTSIKPDPIVTILCPHGFDPAITVHSGNYASDVAMTRTRFSAANTTRGMSTESSADRLPVETHGNRSGTLLPVMSRTPRIMSFHEPLWDAEKGSHQDNVKIMINF
jgi:hypothetical protein